MASNKKQTKIFGLSTSGIAVICSLCLCVSIVYGLTKPSNTNSIQPTAPLATAIFEESKVTDNPPTKPVIGPTRVPTSTTEPLPTQTSLNAGELGQVVRILDGDTIDVNLNGKVFRVRYIGINTPEKGQPCFTESTQANVGLVYKQQVRLVKDVSETDKYDRLLRYVYVGDSFVNAVLVKQGWAEAVEYPPDTSQANYLERLETEARNAGRGCHPSGVFNGAVVAASPTTAPRVPTATTAPILPTPTPKIILPTQAPVQNCNPS